MGCSCGKASAPQSMPTDKTLLDQGGEKQSPAVLGCEQSKSVAVSLEDTAVTLCPYFRLKDETEFKKIWQADYETFFAQR
jgi:hypothetical protein